VPHRQRLPLTAEEQANLTPEAVLADLLNGNRRYAADALTKRELSARRQASATEQFPKAVVLTCLDSRIPVESIFDQCIGDLFVGRNAGNVANPDQLGSMEFATKISGAKLVMVLGHEDCGAVMGACDGAELGNLTQLLAKIHPALATLNEFPPDERHSRNPEFVAAAIAANVLHQVHQVRTHSPLLTELEKEGKIEIRGAHYSLTSGEVTLLDRA
jgi:carbonic anhydrase